MERVQYKKAMEEYNAAKIETDALDGPSAKQAKHVIEIEDDVSTVSPIPGNDDDVMTEISRAVASRLHCIFLVELTYYRAIIFPILFPF